VATIHVPGTGIGPHGRRARRAAVLAAVALAFAAIVVPFALRDVGRHGAAASATTQSVVPLPTPAAHPHRATDAGVGLRGDLPALLPDRGVLSDGTHVRLGDITSGVLRRMPEGSWQVLVRWDGRFQPAPLRGPVSLAGSGSQAETSWVSREGVLYTRVALAAPGRYRVFAWEPRGGTVYTPPALFATALGQVCFNSSFTAFGDCRVAG
jgi:hypothetical protein